MIYDKSTLDSAQLYFDIRKCQIVLMNICYFILAEGGILFTFIPAG